MKPRIIAAALAAGIIASGSVAFAEEARLSERRRDFYQPQAKHVVIHEGRVTEGCYTYILASLGSLRSQVLTQQSQ